MISRDFRRRIVWQSLLAAAVTCAGSQLLTARAAESLRLYDTSFSQAAYATSGVELPGANPRGPARRGVRESLASLPGDPNQPVVIDNNLVLPNPAAPDPILNGFRNRALQGVEFDSTYLARRGREGFGSADQELTSTVAIPFPFLIDESAFLFTPDGQAHFLDGPDAPDLPPRLFDASLQVAWVGKLPHNFAYDIGIQPGWHSDGENETNTAFRLPFYLAAGYRVQPNLLVGVGAAYLDRVDVHWVPLAGLIWVPDEKTRGFELVPPRPRIAHRFWVGNGFERWWYFAGEFGGGQYAIRRADGANDVTDIEDWRIINGMEQVPTNGGLGFRIEYGYVFARHVSYASGTSSFDPPSTLMARLGVVY